MQLWAIHLEREGRERKLKGEEKVSIEFIEQASMTAGWEKSLTFTAHYCFLCWALCTLAVCQVTIKLSWIWAFDVLSFFFWLSFLISALFSPFKVINYCNFYLLFSIQFHSRAWATDPIQPETIFFLIEISIDDSLAVSIAFTYFFGSVYFAISWLPLLSAPDSNKY